MRTAFGDMLRQFRATERIGLRKFAERIGMDASNYSRIERGEAPPPSSEELLVRMAAVFQITPPSDEWFEFKYVADVARGDIPDDLNQRKEIAALMPAFFARLRRESVCSEEEMYELFRQVLRQHIDRE